MNTRKLRILVDIDGTVAQFNEKINNEWSKRYPEFPSLKIKSWYIDEIYGNIYGPWAKEDIRDIFCGPNFFDNLPIIDGAIEALNEMVKEGHEVFFCTSIPDVNYEYSAKDKYTWVNKYFGKEWLNRIILTSDKTFISADYIIDDKPKITGLQTPPLWKHIYYTQPYNINLSGPRITHWSQWRDVITRLETNRQ